MMRQGGAMEETDIQAGQDTATKHVKSAVTSLKGVLMEDQATDLLQVLKVTNRGL